MQPRSHVFQDVSDTARWVAVYRAMESERPDALFRDEWARVLGGERGEEMVRRLGDTPDMGWAVVVRTAVLDDTLLRMVAGARVGAVLNLAAGLDTRPYRLAFPSDVRWIEADLPATVAYKTRLLEAATPRCELVRVGLDLADSTALNNLLDGLEAEGRDTLVLTEGLLVYLEAELVRALSAALAARPHLHYWLLDIAGPLALNSAYSRNLQDELEAADARMRFAPAEGPGFFRAQGWTPVQVWHAWEEARRLDRAPRWMIEIWENGTPERQQAFRDMARYVLLERSSVLPTVARSSIA